MDVPIGPDRSQALSPTLDAPTAGSLPDRLAAAVDADPVAQSQSLALREAYGAANVPDVLAAVHAGGHGALADLTAQPERYGAFVESPRARDALAMLAGTLPNMDGYGGINAVLTSIPRPSEAQDATSRDASTARTAEAGPDAETRTLNPPGVYITGPDAEATFQALDRYSALDLRFDRVTGRVTDVPLMADGEANLSQRDYALLQLLRDMGKDITLETTRSDRPIDRDGNVQNLAVGMYDGSDTDQQSGQVSARNVFNLRHAEVLERVAGASVGGSALHELVEAYAGARSSPGVHYSQSSYGTAHSYASSLDENPVLPWKTDFATDPTTGEIYVAIVVDKDPSVPGYEDVNNLYRVR